MKRRRIFRKMMLEIGMLAMMMIMRESFAFFVTPSSHGHFPLSKRINCKEKTTEPLLQLRSIPPPNEILIVVDYSDDDDEGDDTPPLAIVNDFDEEDEEEEDDDDDESRDPYTQVAKSEFYDDLSEKLKGKISLVRALGGHEALSKVEPTTRVDWGGALGRLRDRVEDIQTGESRNPSKALFRLMSSQSPSQAIANFATHANPRVVQAMSNTVSTMMGGLFNPFSGVEMVAKASGEKMASLCFQLQMTGYMFRNAEYVLALKEIMDLHDLGCTLKDYRKTFKKLDKDRSGYIEASEVKTLMDKVVYQGKTPQFEIDAFVKFFDQDKDGKVSWDDFQRGFGTAVMAQTAERRVKLRKLLSSESSLQNPSNKRSPDDDYEEDDDDQVPEMSASVSGTILIEMDDGETIEVDAAEYIDGLKKEAQFLKDQLRREKFLELPADKSTTSAVGGGAAAGTTTLSAFLTNQRKDIGSGNAAMDSFGGISNYINSRQGDMSALTEGISSEIVETMNLLVDYVLEGGNNKKSGKGGFEGSDKGGKGAGRDNKTTPPSSSTSRQKRTEMIMEIPAPALRQLALWQLVLGYRLREAEAKGDYLHLLRE